MVFMGVQKEATPVPGVGVGHYGNISMCYELQTAELLGGR